MTSPALLGRQTQFKNKTSISVINSTRFYVQKKCFLKVHFTLRNLCLRS